MAKRKATEATPVVEPAPRAAPALGAAPSAISAPLASTEGNGYTVLARRYRPQQFADLVGQEPVAQALANAVASHRVAHAYLFAGARGVGKTSAARILAKALNCVTGPTTQPCDRCDNCKAIATGEDTDVLEIDGASNRGIDEVREIRSNVQYRPQHSHYKIYIIDEVHMLTTHAFNALLKTLEEPPPHVKFIFATTEANQLPITILSRCQRFDFSIIPLPRLVERLRGVVADEGMQADDEALELVAKRARGSMRDAQSLLDQLLAFGHERLSAAHVHQLLGTANEEHVAAIAGAVLARDLKAVLDVVTQLVQQGQQLGELLDQLLDYWRDLMVVKAAGLEGQDLSVSSQHRAALKQHADQTSLDTLLASLDILAATKMRMRNTTHGRVLLEMALVRLCRLEELVSLGQLAQMLSSGTPAALPASAGAPASSATGPADQKKKLTPEPAAVLSNGTGSSPPESVEAVWSKLLSEVGFAIAGKLKRTLSYAISGPNFLVLRAAERYNVPGQGFFEPGEQARVEETLLKVTGAPWGVSVEFVAEPKSSTQSQGPAPGLVQARQQREELKQMPLVKKVFDLFAAQPIRSDEGFGTEFGTETAQPQPSDGDDLDV